MVASQRRSINANCFAFMPKTSERAYQHDASDVSDSATLSEAHMILELV
ncbi:hypothetical protein [Campylobacter concisus]|nr:hypothetical protein [Campylobacter concisus]